MARWAAERGFGVRTIVPVETVWRLAQAWYPGREQTGWRPRPPEETAAVFTSVGLTGPFWATD